MSEYIVAHNAWQYGQGDQVQGGAVAVGGRTSSEMRDLLRGGTTASAALSEELRLAPCGCFHTPASSMICTTDIVGCDVVLMDRL